MSESHVFHYEAGGAIPTREQANKHIDAVYKAATMRERMRMADELEDAATDCDGHTPYSILMALAREARERED